MSEAEGNAKPEGQEAEQENSGEPASDLGDLSPAVHSKTDDKDKVELFLKAAGDAPIMKKRKWVVPKTRTVSWVAEFIRRYLKLDKSENLFLYVNQAFAPAPDQTCGNLLKCYGSFTADGTHGSLVLHYSKVQAWG